MTTAPTPRGVDRNVLARAGSIMTAFTDTRQLLSLDELSTRSQLPRSTTHRLAAGLVEAGWLEYDASGYRVGASVFRTGRLAERRRRMRAVALPFIDELARSTGCGATLGVLAQDSVVCVGHRSYGDASLGVREGASMPAGLTALGQALTDRSASSTARMLHPAFRGGRDWLCHAAPVRGRRGVVAAISVSAPAERAPSPAALAALREVVEAVAEEWMH